MSFLDFLFGKRHHYEEVSNEPSDAPSRNSSKDEELKHEREKAERRIARLRELTEEYEYEQFERERWHPHRP